MKLFFQPTGGNAGGSSTPTPPVQIVHDGDLPEGYDATADESLGDNWQEDLAKEIAGGKKATVRANARREGVDESELPELEGEEGEEGDEPEEEPELEEEGEEGDEPEGITRDDGATWNAEAGRWVKDGKFVAGDPPEGEAETEGEGTETGEGGEGEGGAQPKGLTVIDADGDEVELPAMTVKFKAPNGKEYAKDLPGLVELAGRGIYNHQLQQEVKQAREATHYTKQLEGVVGQYEERDQQYNAYLERLFTDDDFFATEVQAFAEDNTPERKIARAQEQLTRERASIAQEREAAKADTVLRTSVWPAVEALQKKYPTIKPQELLAEIGAVIAPLKVNGRVPVARLPEVVDAIEAQLAPWAAQIHEARSEGVTRTQRTRDKAAKDAAARQQRETAENKRLRKIAARAIAPTGGRGARTGATAGARPAMRPPKNAQQAADQALERALAASGV